MSSIKVVTTISRVSQPNVPPCAGSQLRQFSVEAVVLPKVHPNILGPGLAQFSVLDISGSVMTDHQQGTVFFSILDTRKVRALTLQSCDLTSVNFVILATSVGCVERANLRMVRRQRCDMQCYFLLLI